MSPAEPVLGSKPLSSHVLTRLDCNEWHVTPSSAGRRKQRCDMTLRSIRSALHSLATDACIT